MYILILLILTVFISLSCVGHNNSESTLHNARTAYSEPNDNFVLTWGGAENDYSRTVQVDNEGNIIVAGQFSNTVDFDPGYSRMVLSSNGISDMFLSKFGSDGVHMWTKVTEGRGFKTPQSITVDPSCNIYATGVFQDSIDLNPGFGCDLYTAGDEGAYGSYVIAYDENGNKLWHNVISGERTNSISINEILFVENHGLYMLGKFNGEIQFTDDLAISSSRHYSEYVYSTFIMNISQDGQAKWIENWGSPYVNTYGSDLTSGNHGIYIIGECHGINQNNITYELFPGLRMETQYGNIDTYILKLSLDGEIVWVKGLDARGYHIISSESINYFDDTNIVISGSYSGIIYFGLHDEPVFTANGDTRGSYMFSISDSGQLNWAENILGNITRINIAPHLLPTENILISGIFKDYVIFNSSKINACSENYSLFVAEYDGDGNFIKCSNWSGQGSITGGYIWTIPSGEIFLVGGYQSGIFHNGNTISEFSTNNGMQDCFLIKTKL